MLEQFRQINFKGRLKIGYTDGSGAKNIWEADQQELLARIVGIIENYQAQGIILTNRQLYYQLVAADYIPNAQEVYKRICVFLTDARYAGLIDWDALEDRGRVPEMHAEWENVKGLVNSAVASYRLPRWKDQENYVELYCEKQAMESVLKPVADKYHIFFGCNKGYSSAATMYSLAQRIKDKLGEGKHVTVFYLGDHDPSGLDMVRDIETRLEEFCTKGLDDYGFDVEIIPVALNMEQIKQYKCPPNPTKITDSRAKAYIRRFGTSSWELDSLNPKVLQELTAKAIQSRMDVEKYNAWMKKEKRQIEKLQDYADEMSEEGGEE